jgi:hypothetical protein
LAVLLDLKLISVNNIVDGAEFPHHFLMMGMALSCSPRFYLSAHDDINLDALAVVGGQTEELLVLLEKLDVLSVFHLVPVVKHLLSVPFSC